MNIQLAVSHKIPHISATESTEGPVSCEAYARTPRIRWTTTRTASTDTFSTSRSRKLPSNSVMKLTLITHRRYLQTRLRGRRSWTGFESCLPGGEKSRGFRSGLLVALSWMSARKRPARHDIHLGLLKWTERSSLNSFNAVKSIQARWKNNATWGREMKIQFLRLHMSQGWKVIEAIKDFIWWKWPFCKPIFYVCDSTSDG